MKKYILGSIILAIIAVCTVVSHQYTKKAVDDLNSRIDIVYGHIDKDDYASALKDVDNIKERFEDANEIIAIYTSHTKLDEISASINRLSAYIENENKNDSLAELKNIHARLDIIYDEEKISFVNIL